MQTLLMATAQLTLQVSQSQRALENVSGGEMSSNLESARAEYHSRVAQEGRGHLLGGPGAYVFMTLLDELKAGGLPADNILTVLHQSLEARDTRGLPLTNDLVRVVRFRRIPPGQATTADGAPRSPGAAAAASDEASPPYRLSLQVGWDLLTKLRLDLGTTPDQPQLISGITLISRLNETLEAALKAAGADVEAGIAPPSKAERRVRHLLRD
jgi:hypothetical protein